MAKNKTMAIKHKKARVEAMKEANEIRLRGVMGDYQHGWTKAGADGVGLYFSHAKFVAGGNKSTVKKFEKLVV